eukprot:CAMPEP_0197239170 /NCGR_PEP_ID=MMETSP1429-20130617/5684_1 /TAXON_ID=49237 /ORGANISM="Chaetoceros  sp., Strain UNC1202" /LENGTH=45 /DNA_ID= /DNA_START= /DNA_END= /DNA_ORIENTATION=
MGLCGKVHDGVDLALLKDVSDEITAGDVSLDESIVGKFLDFVEVL